MRIVGVRSICGAVLACLLLGGLIAPSVALASRTIGLSWLPAADPDITGYIVYLGTASQEYTYSFTVPADQVDVSISDLAEGQTYFFTVTSVNSMGLESAPTEEVAYAVPLAPSGNYNGLFYEQEARRESAGSFTISVTKSGTYSGKVQNAAGRFSFKGRIDSEYQATSLIPRKSIAPLTIQFTLGTGAEADTVSGSITDGGWIAGLSGDRAVFNSKTYRSWLAGRYTMIFPGQNDDPALPTGDGYATVLVGSDGIGRFAGVLGDQTKLTLSAPLSGHAQCPLFASLYSKGGMIIGWLDYTVWPDHDIDGTLSWVKPFSAKSKIYRNGFTFETQAAGSAYSASSATFTNGTISFSGGNLGTEFTNTFVMGAKGKGIGASGSGLTFTFSASSGAFKGKTVDPTSHRSLPFGGVVLPKSNAGRGLMLGTNQTSKVVLTP